MGKSAILKCVAPQPLIPPRQKQFTWTACWIAKYALFGGAVLCCKLKVYARLEDWIKTDSFPMIFEDLMKQSNMHGLTIGSCPLCMMCHTNTTGMCISGMKSIRANAE